MPGCLRGGVDERSIHSSGMQEQQIEPSETPGPRRGVEDSQRLAATDGFFVMHLHVKRIQFRSASLPAISPMRSPGARMPSNASTLSAEGTFDRPRDLARPTMCTNSSLSRATSKSVLLTSLMSTVSGSWTLFYGAPRFPKNSCTTGIYTAGSLILRSGIHLYRSNRRLSSISRKSGGPGQNDERLSARDGLWKGRR